MEKIVITATAESYEQARELLELGVDRIYIGEKALAFVCLSLFHSQKCERLQSWYMSQARN